MFTGYLHENHNCNGMLSSRQRRRRQWATRWQQQQRQRGVDDGSSRAAATQQWQQLQGGVDDVRWRRQRQQGGVDDVRWWRQQQQGQQGSASGSMHQFFIKKIIIIPCGNHGNRSYHLYREYKWCGVHPWPVRVRFWQVWVRCHKMWPTVNPWQSLVMVDRPLPFTSHLRLFKMV